MDELRRALLPHSTSRGSPRYTLHFNVLCRQITPCDPSFVMGGIALYNQQERGLEGNVCTDNRQAGMNVLHFFWIYLSWLVTQCNWLALTNMHWYIFIWYAGSLAHVRHVLYQGPPVSPYHYHTLHMGTLLIIPNHIAHLMTLINHDKLTGVHYDRVQWESPDSRPHPLISPRTHHIKCRWSVKHLQFKIGTASLKTFFSCRRLPLRWDNWVSFTSPNSCFFEAWIFTLLETEL